MVYSVTAEERYNSNTKIPI